MTELEELNQYLNKRIEELGIITSLRITPGEKDSIEHQLARGRLAEAILTLRTLIEIVGD